MPTTRTDWAAVAHELGSRFGARAASHDADDSFVAENYAELKGRRLLSAGVPGELGGGDASYGELCTMLRTLARHCSSTALALSMHTHQVAMAAWRWRQDRAAPAERLLRRVATEQLVLVSTGGSDWLWGSGRAEKVDGGYRVTGRKVFSSGAPSGDLLMTTAIYEDPETGPTVLHFPVPMSAEGVRLVETWRTLGMRGTGSHDVLLEEVFVPESAVGVRRPSGVWTGFMHVIPKIALPIIYAVYAGVAEAARDLALRQAVGKRDDPAVQYLVGEMETELALVRSGLAGMIEAGASAEPGPETTNAVLIGRTLVGRSALRTVEKAMEVVGGASFFRALGLERLFRDVQGARFHPLPEKAQLRYTGRLTLALPLEG